MSEKRTELLTPVVQVSDLPEPIPQISRFPLFAVVGAFAGLFLALIQFGIIQDPEPEAIYTTFWTLLLWPFGLAGAGLVADYWRTQRQVSNIAQWSARMLAYALTIQARHAVTDHTKAALDPATLRAMVEDVMGPRIEQLRAETPEPIETLSAKIAGKLAVHKHTVLTTLLAWIKDADHVWTSEQWAMMEALVATVDSGVAPKVKATRALSLEAPPHELAELIVDHPTEAVKAALEWVTDTNTQWTAQEWRLVENIADAVTDDFEPKIEARRRSSRTS